MAITDPDDIIERLTKRKEFQTNLKDVFNEEDLENAIKKSFDEDKRRDTLIEIKEVLFNSEKVKLSVVDNSIETINKSESLQDLNSTFDNITTNIGEVGRVNELKIQTAQAERQKELARETPEQLTREQLLDLGVQGTSFKKSASRIGISESDFRIALEREGFTITENNRIKK